MLKELKDNFSLQKALELEYKVGQIVAYIDKSVNFFMRLEILAHQIELHLDMMSNIYCEQVYKLETLVASKANFNS